MYHASTGGCRVVLNVLYRSPRSGDAADCEASLRRIITVRNPAVAGNILRVLLFCRLTLGAKLMTQEESHPDQEGHADNRGRRQSGQVTEQGALLSGRPTGLPARPAVTSLPA